MSEFEAGGVGTGGGAARRNGAPPRSAIILCGGRSSRFGGRDKALAELNGRPLLALSIETARAVADDVWLSTGRSARYPEFGLPVVLDPVPDRGPLAGVAAGLAAARHAVFVLLAVDLPLVTPAAIEQLAAHLGAGIDLVVTRTDHGIEPLCCVGRTAACLAAANKLLNSADQVAARDLARSVATVELPVARNDPGDPLARAILNVNDPEDLERMIREGTGNDR